MVCLAHWISQWLSARTMVTRPWLLGTMMTWAPDLQQILLVRGNRWLLYAAGRMHSNWLHDAYSVQAIDLPNICLFRNKGAFHSTKVQFDDKAGVNRETVAQNRMLVTLTLQHLGTRMTIGVLEMHIQSFYDLMNINVSRASFCIKVIFFW